MHFVSMKTKFKSISIMTVNSVSIKAKLKPKFRGLWLKDDNYASIKAKLKLKFKRRWFQKTVIKWNIGIYR